MNIDTYIRACKMANALSLNAQQDPKVSAGLSETRAATEQRLRILFKSRRQASKFLRKYIDMTSVEVY
jgi:hypothetical protein